MVPIIAILTTFGVPCAIIITIAVLRHRQKMELVRQGINPNTAVPSYPGNKPLLWGLILIGLGVAGIVTSIYDSDHDFMRFGILSLGAGIALLVYWKVSEPDRKRAMRLYEEKFMTESAVTTLSGPSPAVNPPELNENETPGSSERGRMD